MAETYSAGIVTAYGAAVRGGYTGTYEEFCAEQASFAENAEQVAQDREDMEALAAQFSGTTVPAAVQTVQNAGAAQIQAVESASETEQQQIALAGAAQETRVTQAGDDQVDAVDEAGATQVGNVNAAGTTQVGNVNTAGTTQVNAVQAKGQEVIDSIPEDFTDLQNEVGDLKSDIGDLTDLETTDKSSLVGAINEARGTGGSGSGLTADIKTALLQIAQKVAYIDEHGQDYYDDLYDALYAITAITLNTNSISMQSIGATSQLTATTTPEGGNVTWSSSNTSVATVSSTGLVTSVAYGSATITATAGSVSATCSVVVAQATCTGITATYTQSGTVYDTTSLDDLKADLVVTASWSNGTTTTLTDSDYTLSGTLATGTSTITASFGGQTDTFDVTVTALSFIYNLPAETTFNGSSDYIDTGVQLYKTDVDFTILGHAQYERFANSYNVLMHCMHEEKPWNGSLIDHPSSGLRFAWGSGGFSEAGNTYPLDIKFAITHTAGSNVYTVRVQNGTNTDTQDVSWTFASIDETLILGAYQTTSSAKGRYFAGTIYDFAIVDGVVAQSYIDNYFA